MKLGKILEFRIKGTFAFDQGEAYKLFWPDQPEFVRMAARFGVTIVPFGVIGEDDLTEVLLDVRIYIGASLVDFMHELEN